MPINRIYNGNRLIRCFTDSEMRHNFLPIPVRSDKITYACSNSNFNNAFVINHVNGKHTINIDWNRIIMTKPVEVFDLYIKYDGDVRITECVRIEYPLSEVRFNVQLSKKSGIWGEQPNCELIITPSYSRSEEWKYKNKLVRVSFEKEHCRGDQCNEMPLQEQGAEHGNFVFKIRQNRHFELCGRKFRITHICPPLQFSP